MIHTIGDSHCHFPWERIMHKVGGNIVPAVKAHRCGPTLAFSAGRDGLKRVNISNKGMKPNDWIVFSFGEIDCRAHIHKHRQQNSYQNQIDHIVKTYFNTIKLNKDLIKFDINIAVNNIVPVTPYERLKKFNNITIAGTDEQRKTYVKYFNSKLKEYCDLNNYLFIDIHARYADNNGFLIPQLSDGNLHIGNPKYIIDFLREHSFPNANEFLNWLDVPEEEKKLHIKEIIRISRS